MYAKRNSSSVPGFYSNCSSNSFVFGSTSQRLLHIQGGGGAWSLGPHPLPYLSYPPPAPTYSSLPPPNLLQHPYLPLLPLPTSKSLSLPSPSPMTSRMVNTPTFHLSNKDQKKPRSSAANPKKDPQRAAMRPQKVPSAAVTPPARVPKPSATAAATSPCKDEKSVEGNVTDDVYALSPPPSSLPMPKFSLRARTPSSLTSCNAEAFGSGAALVAGIDAGASDDLRRLLRL